MYNENELKTQWDMKIPNQSTIKVIVSEKGSSNYVIQHNAQNVGETGKNSDEITTKIVIENQSCEKGIPFINET